MGFEKRIVIKPVPRRESARKEQAAEKRSVVESEQTFDEVFEYKTGGNHVLKDMFKTLMMSLAKDDFETFCDNTPEKEALLEDFERRKAAMGNPIQYGYITYAMEILREAQEQASSH